MDTFTKKSSSPPISSEEEDVLNRSNISVSPDIILSAKSIPNLSITSDIRLSQDDILENLTTVSYLKKLTTNTLLQNTHTITNHSPTLLDLHMSDETVCPIQGEQYSSLSQQQKRKNAYTTDGLMLL